VYEVRPMICRLWGMTPGMRCQFGCEPEGGFLTERQGYEFLARVAELGGNAADAARFRAPFEVDPEGAERAALAAQRHRDLEYDRRARRPSAVFVTGCRRV
jgi:hypothetical protein